MWNHSPARGRSVGHAREVVDGADVHRAGRADHQEGLQARRAVGGDRAAQRGT